MFDNRILLVPLINLDLLQEKPCGPFQNYLIFSDMTWVRILQFSQSVATTCFLKSLYDKGEWNPLWQLTRTHMKLSLLLSQIETWHHCVQRCFLVIGNGMFRLFSQWWGRGTAVFCPVVWQKYFLIDHVSREDKVDLLWCLLSEQMKSTGICGIRFFLF